MRPASLIKLLIFRARTTQGPLPDRDLKTASAMIERSDNDAATRLWLQAGGSRALAAVVRTSGMTDTRQVPPGPVSGSRGSDNGT